MLALLAFFLTCAGPISATLDLAAFPGQAVAEAPAKPVERQPRPRPSPDRGEVLAALIAKR